MLTDWLPLCICHYIIEFLRKLYSLIHMVQLMYCRLQIHWWLHSATVGWVAFLQTWLHIPTVYFKMKLHMFRVIAFINVYHSVDIYIGQRGIIFTAHLFIHLLKQRRDIPARCYFFVQYGIGNIYYSVMCSSCKASVIVVGITTVMHLTYCGSDRR